MKAKAFCEYFGFKLDFVMTYTGHYRIDVYDTERHIYKSGYRRGTTNVNGSELNKKLIEVYWSLKDHIIDKIFN